MCVPEVFLWIFWGSGFNMLVVEAEETEVFMFFVFCCFEIF